MRRLAVVPVAAELGVAEEAVVILVGFRDVELRYGHGGDLLEHPGVAVSSEGGELRLLGLNLGGGALGKGGESMPLLQEGGKLAANGRCKLHLLLAALVAFGLVALAPLRGNLLVVTGQGFEGLVGHALVEFLAADEADDGVAALDVMVEEIERLAGIVRLQPKGDFAEFDGERVEVNAVDTFADGVAQRGAVGGRRRLLFARADGGQFGGDAAGGGEKNVAGAAGDVGDSQAQKSLRSQ